MSSVDDLKQAADALAPTLVRWRRRLHRRPELGFEERETAAFVAERLTEIGLEMRTGLARTGVAALLRASNPTRPAILLRADMDALPIQEVSGREYGSEIDGRMHACGHDGHTTMLLGAARLLTERADRLERDVLFCFQPAEEGLGGAERMIDDGVLDWIEIGQAFGIHLWSWFESGTIHVRPGPTMAAQDEFTATFRGRGGHGALPHAALDPIVAASQGIVALQSIVSRSVDPVEPAVVTVGSIHAGSAPNIIPEEAVLQGTLRSFDEGVRTILRTRTREILDAAARGAGCTLELDLRGGFPAVVNDPAAVEVVRGVARDVVGPDRLYEPAPLAAAEDFAYFLKRVPGAFVFLGVRNEARGITAPHHSPQFDIDEDVLPRGSELFARLALAP